MSHPQGFRACALLFTLLLFGFVNQLWADLTGVTGTIPVAAYEADEVDMRMPLAIDTNPVTGEYVVCYAFFSAPPDLTLQCTRFDSANTVLSTSQQDFPAFAPVGFMEIEVDLNNQGLVYVVWYEPNSIAYLAGFDSDGTALFEPIALDGFWPDVSVAATPDYVWVGGWARLTEGGNPEVTFLTARQYAQNGTFIDVITPIQFESDITTPCRASDLAASTSGDLLLTWVTPSTLPFCFGTVWANTFTQDGTAIASNIQLSATITSGGGLDISGNLSPRAVAHDNGEYAVVWQSFVPDERLQSAAITAGGTVAVPPDNLLSTEFGAPLKVAGFPQNLDYVAFVGIGSPDPDCFLTGRLVFASDPTPDASFSGGFCSMGFDVTFNQAGDMMLARFSNPDFEQAGQVEVAIIPRPAEIQISPISMTEGDPSRGIGNFATLTAALTRPHPLGDDVTVNYFTSDNTAFAGSDYQQTSDTLIFFGAQGQTEQILQIPIIPDIEYEANEIFSVNLSGANDAVIKKGNESVNVIILNDDVSPEILADCDADNPTMCQAIQEMSAGQFTHALITLTMAEPVGLPVNLSFATQPGGPDPTRFATPGSDYVNVSGTLQIPPGATEASFTVTVVGDDVPENTETFQVVLSAGSSITLPQATLTFSILDDNLCFLEIDPETLVFDTGGHTLQIELTTLDNTCQWAATPDDPWVTLDPSSGSGSQTIQVTADPWDPMGVMTRSTNVTIELTGGNASGSVVLNVSQNDNCSFTADPTSAEFAAGAGAGSIEVTASDPACKWSVSSEVPWINITSPTTEVTGNGTVQYSVSANGSLNVENPPRMTALYSDQFSFDVTQDGCTYEVDPATVPVAAGGNDAVNVNVLAGPTVCQWSAVSNSTWIIISGGASGSGDGNVTLDVIENPSVVPRTGSITIADEMVTFEQEGQPCNFEASPDSIDFCPDGDAFSIDVTALAGCEWNLVDEVDWIAVMSNASGSGDEMAMGLVDANLSESGRASSVSLVSVASGLTVDEVQVQQQGFLEYEPFDGALPADWIFDPMGAFSITGGQLQVALAGGGLGRAIHQNSMGTCSDCKVESTMDVTSVTSQSQEVATLAGWYLSDDDFIGFGMDEFANRWNLYQVSGGVVVESSSVMVDQILPNQPYAVSIRYDGTTFRAYVDGMEMVAIDRNDGSSPFGYAGFMVQGSNARFTELRVTGVFQDGQIIISNSFESSPTGLLSICTQE